MINPGIPSTWTEYFVSRSFRGVTYNFKVKRGVKGQKIHVKVNNSPIDENIIPIPPPEIKEVTVDVQIG
jgi:cellobiose phosphorylase